MKSIRVLRNAAKCAAFTIFITPAFGSPSSEANLWRNAEGTVGAPIPEKWAASLVSPRTSYVSAMTPTGPGRVIAENGNRQLVYFVAESKPSESRDQVESQNSLLGIYRMDTESWEPGMYVTNSSHLGSSRGCWVAKTSHLFYGDINDDGRLDIGLVEEQISCRSNPEPTRKHTFSDLYWYTQEDYAEGYELWRSSFDHKDQCPRNGLSMINPSDETVTAIDKSLQRRHDLDSRDLTVPACVERLIGVRETRATSEQAGASSEKQ